MTLFIKYFKIAICFISISFLLLSNGHAANSTHSKIKLPMSKVTLNLLQLAVVDLPKVLAYIMVKDDVFQGQETVVYKDVDALKLRIFNKKSGQVRYIYIDAKSGNLLK